MDRLAPTMLAGLVSLSAGFTMFDASFAPPARADDEEVRHSCLAELSRCN